MKRIFKNSSQEAVMGFLLPNLEHQLKIKGIETPLFIHFGLDTTFSKEKVRHLKDARTKRHDLLLHPNTYTKDTKDNVETISLNEEYFYQEIKLEETRFLTSETFLNNLLQEIPILSFIRDQNQWYIVLTKQVQTEKNEEKLTISCDITIKQITEKFEEVVSYMDYHYPRINWDRMRGKFANMSHSMTKIIELAEKFSPVNTM